jgi:D-alanine-D-alanine ligase
MKILVLHSDVADGAPPEEQDTLIAAAAVADALAARGHRVSSAVFTKHPAELEQRVRAASPDMVFNLVEGIEGLGALAHQAPRMLSDMGVLFTGVGADPMELTGDKPRTKALLREAGLATPDWSAGPQWRGLDDRRKWIVKSAIEDASLGLDDGCVVMGMENIRRRAAQSAAAHGGEWFAEEFVDGREFNIALLGNAREFKIFPMAEMRFDAWPDGKPRIVGYDAKWEEDSAGWTHTVRAFGVERDEPVLAAKIADACARVWRVFDLTGFVRVDFRVTETGEPLILEINANPCISPDAGFAAAAAEAGMPYDVLVEEIVRVAL